MSFGNLIEIIKSEFRAFKFEVWDFFVGPPQHREVYVQPTRNIQPQNSKPRSARSLRSKKKPVFNPKPQIDTSLYFDNTPLHMKRGWEHVSRNRYIGYFRCRYGASRGEITRRGNRFFVYIWDPPPEVNGHDKWICFYHVTGSKYKIDLAQQPAGRDLDSIIFYVERILIESFELAHEYGD